MEIHKIKETSSSQSQATNAQVKALDARIQALRKQAGNIRQNPALEQQSKEKQIKELEKKIQELEKQKAELLSKAGRKKTSSTKTDADNWEQPVEQATQTKVLSSMNPAEKGTQNRHNPSKDKAFKHSFYSFDKRI